MHESVIIMAMYGGYRNIILMYDDVRQHELDAVRPTTSVLPNFCNLLYLQLIVAANRCICNQCDFPFPIKLPAKSLDNQDIKVYD